MVTQEFHERYVTLSDLKIGIIVGSTRPGRNGLQVGQWVKDNATAEGVEFELVDLHDYKLPMLEEPFPAGAGNYLGDEANAWAHKVAEFDHLRWGISQERRAWVEAIGVINQPVASIAKREEWIYVLGQEQDQLAARAVSAVGPRGGLVQRSRSAGTSQDDRSSR